MTHDQWGSLLQDLKESIGAINYKNWIEPLTFEGLSDGVATFGVPTSFLGIYVSRNYGDLLLYKINNAG